MLLGLLHWDRFGPDDPVTADVRGPSYEDQPTYEDELSLDEL